MNISYSILSKYRRGLMGLAIMLIMLFHLNIWEYGEIGVEFFLILSGIGLTYSRHCYPRKYPHYLVHRLMRVIPLYLLFASVFYYCIKQFPFSSISVLYNISFISLLLNGNLTYWFIFIITCFYIIFPFLEKLYSSFNMVYILCVFVALPLCYILATLFPKNEILWNRLPVCLLAVPIGAIVTRGQNVSIKLLSVLTCAGVCLLLLNKFGIWNSLTIPLGYVSGRRLSFFFLVVPALLASTIIVRIPIIDKFLDFCGSITLELYMIHELFAIPLSVSLLSYMGLSQKIWLVVIFSILLALALAFCVNRVLTPLLKLFENKILSLLPE